MIHGGRIWEASRDLGLAHNAILDFSANINPYGPPEGVLDALAASLREIAHYPDPDATELTAVIAEDLGVDPAAVLVTNGGAEAIALLPPALRASRVICCSPTFSEYAQAGEAWGCEVVNVPTTFVPGEERFARAVYEAAGAASPGAIVFICNPNNPTGEYAQPAMLDAAYSRVRSMGGTLVVDESFMDFVDAGAAGLRTSDTSSIVRTASQSEGLVVVRSLTKFYSLPGLRLGYVVALPGTCRRLRRLLPHWSVNHLAQRAGVAALRDVSYRSTAALLTQHREELRAVLNNTRLVTAFSSATNFILLRIGPGSHMNSASICRMMRQRAVLVRDCSSFPGMGLEYLRVAVRLPGDNVRMLNALVETLGDAANGL